MSMISTSMIMTAKTITLYTSYCITKISTAVYSSSAFLIGIISCISIHPP